MLPAGCRSQGSSGVQRFRSDGACVHTPGAHKLPLTSGAPWSPRPLTLLCTARDSTPCQCLTSVPMLPKIQRRISSGQIWPWLAEEWVTGSRFFCRGYPTLDTTPVWLHTAREIYACKPFVCQHKREESIRHPGTAYSTQHTAASSDTVPLGHTCVGGLFVDDC